MPTSDSTGVADAVRAARARHWRRTRRLTAALLLIWFGVGFGVTWFARDLDFPFFGWPFSFWMAAQGGVIVFLVLLAVYASRMARIDRLLEVESEDGRAGDEASR
jgi:putative solute:sodium symporter small subunit